MVPCTVIKKDPSKTVVLPSREPPRSSSSIKTDYKKTALKPKPSISKERISLRCVRSDIPHWVPHDAVHLFVTTRQTTIKFVSDLDDVEFQDD